MLRNIRYALAALALALACTAFAEIQEEDGVLVLTDENFDGALLEHEFILVEFYAPWCGHCKQLAPEYAKAAQSLKQQDSKLPLAKVDATEEKGLAERFEIRGFPTLKFFRNGTPIDYTGGRTEQEIVSWLKKKSGPAAKTLTTVAELEAFQEANEVNVIAIVNDASSASAKSFLEAAGGDDTLVFAIAAAPEVRAKFDVAEGTQAVILSKPFDEKRNDLPLEDTTASGDISKFLTAHARPLVQFFTRENAQAIFASSIQVHLLFFTNPEADSQESLVQTFTEVAKSIRGKALVVNIPQSENRILEYFGLSTADMPVAFFADMRAGDAMKKYKVTGDLVAENVKQVAEDFFAGKLSAHLKSEAPAEDDTTGHVKVVKGLTFEDMVMKSDKDVFLEFYAPWCGHCKKLAPVWEDLGEKFGNGKVMIAKIDATANEVDHDAVAVQGFPTLYYFKASDKAHPFKYDGARELDALEAFINEQTGGTTAAEATPGTDEL